MKRRTFLGSGLAAAAAAVSAEGAAGEKIDLTGATVVVRAGALQQAENTAATMLVEEIERRAGVRLKVATSWPREGAVIAIASAEKAAAARAEGYRLVVERTPRLVVRIEGADARGALYGAGRLLREIDWSRGAVWLQGALDVTTAPVYAIRGHQLGYRPQANSYDAWDAAQFERYIRELTWFGVNSIEGIPFQDTRPTPVMKFSRRAMNKAIGEICYRYGLDYWLWLPAEFDLRDGAKRAALVGECRELFQDCPAVGGVFFPGGDPGSNPPEQVLPFLAELAREVLPIHPGSGIWLSLQGFRGAQVDYTYQYLERESPEWLAGLVVGPSSPPEAETRRRLPAKYKLRLYPDLTHNKLCQYEVPEWDQAWALTSGREAVNPRAAEFAAIFHRVAPFSDGFISYSDGVHDDVNKTVFSALAWDPGREVRDILVDYGRAYFHPRVAGEAADAILALERNWHGPAAVNGAVEATLAAWQGLEAKAGELAGNWRWQMCLLRAHYDAYVRRRLIRESALEREANRILAAAGDPGDAMGAAMAVLNRAVEEPESPALHRRIEELCAELYRSIGLQTSVPKYHAIGEERGAVLDFVDYPMNNRWWLEDEFAKVRALATEEERRRRLHELAAWENPGPGSFYDNPGNLAKAPHVVRTGFDPASGRVREIDTTFWWWDQGKSRARLTWQVTAWPVAMIYEDLDEHGAYVVRSSGYGQALLRINGERVMPVRDGREMGEIKEFPVDGRFVRGGRLVLTWEKPPGEEQLNWRKQSRLAEVWLMKRR